jgi:hypothetical protein
MTTTITVLSQISRRFQVQVDFPVAHRMTIPLDGCTVHNPSMDKATRLMDLANNWENSLKTGWPEWIVQDTARDVEILSESAPMPDPIDPDWVQYNLVISCTVNATARKTIEVDTDLDPETTEGAAFIQEQAEAAAAAWITERAFVAI